MKSLSQAELNQQLEALLNPVLSSRRTAAPLAAPIAALSPAQQHFILHWVPVISRTNYEMAYQFAAAAPYALLTLDAESAAAWIIAAMDAYDREGLHHGSTAFKNFASFAPASQNSVAVAFGDVVHVMQHFVCGLAGRPMDIECAPEPYTDTATIYLPPRIALCDSKEENFLVYKIITTLLWAQSRFGTFNIDIAAAVKRYADPARALEWLNHLENVRLEARIARALPGLARDAACLRGFAETATHLAKLGEPESTVHDSLALLGTLNIADTPLRSPWSGILRPAEAAATRAERLSQEKNALQAALEALLDEQTTSDGGENSFSVDVKQNPQSDTPEFELKRNGTPIAAPDQVRNLLDSILHDLDEIPDDYLTPRSADEGDDDAEVAFDAPLNDTPIYYDEWDFQRRHFRKQWCALREVEVDAGDPEFINATLKKYAPQVAQLKRTFEMLRGEDKLLKRMKHGDDIDLDAVIAAYAEMKSGRELSDRLFAKRHKAERNLAVMFMVDMSGSTKGWINEAERESLVLLTEALEVLGDRYAIYGFSGMTRKRCEIFPIKRFDEPYSALVQQRISGVAPQDYTRMGAAIRHLSALLDAVDARTKLLITLSDGKPDDYSDNYRGEYGIEDTRHALMEAHHAGIKPFCITIDHEARAYLPHMYGTANWALIDEVSRLPFKVADIYRHLTT